MDAHSDSEIFLVRKCEMENDNLFFLVEYFERQAFYFKRIVRPYLIKPLKLTYAFEATLGSSVSAFC